MNFIRLFKFVQRNFGLLLIILLSCTLLFYNLGTSSLYPWDEAWYSTIARNMLNSGNLLEMKYNGWNFWDHPPLGIYLISLSFRIFGVSELAARLPMAVFGLATVLLVYFVGEKLVNKRVGFCAALIIITSRWFLIRARAADLETPLLFLQLLTVFLAYKAKTTRELLIMWLVFSLSLLCKSIISFVLLPMLLFSTFRSKRTTKDILLMILVTLLPLLPWYGNNTMKFGMDFLKQNIFITGIKSGSTSGISFSNIFKFALYLHSGIYMWFFPAILAMILSFVYLKNKVIRWLLIYIFLSAIPYLLSAKTEVWHLLPIYPGISILIPLVFFELASKFKMIPKNISNGLLLGFFIVVGLYLTKIYWFEDVAPVVISIESRLAKTSAKDSLPIVVGNYNYLPTIVYYSRKNVLTDSISSLNEGTYEFIGPEEDLEKISRLKYKTLERYGGIVLAEVQLF